MLVTERFLPQALSFNPKPKQLLAAGSATSIAKDGDLSYFDYDVPGPFHSFAGSAHGFGWRRASDPRQQRTRGLSIRAGRIRLLGWKYQAPGCLCIQQEQGLQGLPQCQGIRCQGLVSGTLISHMGELIRPR